MAPILIDSRGLIKLGFLLVFVTASTFAGGFFTGYQKASDFYQLDAPAEPLMLPEKSTVPVSELDPQTPDVIAAGEQIDVDLASDHLANEKSAQKQQIRTQQTRKQQTRKQQTGGPVKLETSLAQNTSDKKPATHQPEKGIAQLEKPMLAESTVQGEKSSQPVSPVGRVVKNEDQSSGFGRSNINEAKFTVQVGTYGQLSNAENMMKSLQENGLDAYVTDYTNKKNNIRYNVRFGYFSDRKTAQKLLRQYKNSQQGDGYLVKFSARNIVNVAEVKALPVEEAEKQGQQQAPSVLLPAGTAENISQLNISNVSHRSGIN